MFGSQQNINQYKKVSLETGVEAANPVELIVMLYDGAIVACNAAIPFVKQNDYKNRSHYIYKAIRIIQSGLRMSLDHEVGGDIAINLDALYIYMTNQLVKANIEVIEEPIKEVVRLLTELRGAWQQISKTDAAKVAQSKETIKKNDIAYMEKV
ncbi:MAG: flagellar export chaperone FliS [Methylophilaceae bacterium]